MNANVEFHRNCLKFIMPIPIIHQTTFNPNLQSSFPTRRPAHPAIHIPYLIIHTAILHCDKRRLNLHKRSPDAQITCTIRRKRGCGRRCVSRVGSCRDDRSILQSAIARAGVIAGPVTSTGFLDHQHRFGCVPSPGLPISSPVESDRVAEPWFQAQPRPKPIHSPRMADWYGNVADPIERLQVMGTMHQQSLDKCKDVIRSQASVVAAADCAAGFSNSGYPVNFNEVNRERDLRRQENIAEYAEFSDGQKWHPYQVGSWLLE